MNYRKRKLLHSRLLRLRRWEYWPLWVFYPPIVAWILLLAIRYRGLRQLTVVNPAMPTGGLIDSNKAGNLLSLQRESPASVAQTFLIEAVHPDRSGELEAGMTSLTLEFPIILKPNSGQRGLGVTIIRDISKAKSYLKNNAQDILLQEYIEGDEFGVFYIREPKQPKGFIFSITHKDFPYLLGDGVSNVEKLILEDDRALYMASFLMRKHAARLHHVLEEQEKLPLVEIGSHCRGSVFFDANHLITDALTDQIDQISKNIPGYFFGRYDLRAPSAAHLARGEGIKIIEANGLSSESTDIYDPKNSLLNAYRKVFKQWSFAFKVAKQNMEFGEEPSTYSELIAALRTMNR